MTAETVEPWDAVVSVPPALAPVPAGRGAASPSGAGRVVTPSGRSLSAAAARRIRLSTPRNTRRGRESRTALYARWCLEHGRVATDPGTVPDYVAWLADRGHLPDTLEAYVSALAHELALSGRPLDDEDRGYVGAIIDHRTGEVADDADGIGDALQAAECSREDLAAMLGTLDRTTVAGQRDALALTLDWYIGGRSCEPGALDVRDVVEVVAELPGPDGGGRLRLPALRVTIRRSKTNPHGKLRDVVRIVAQDDETCPVAAWRAWREVLAAAGITRGPLLRRVKNGKLTTAGRPPADPARVGGIGERTIRNLIKDTAQAAGLIPELTDEQKRLMSTRAEAVEIAALADEAEREAFAIERRRARRLLRMERGGYSGHSMRRGAIRDAQRRGVPRDIVERQYRYVPGSKALDRYYDDRVPWADNPSWATRRAAADGRGTV